MYSNILICTDGSDLGQRGLDQGLTLAKHLKAKTTILTVTEPFPLVGGSTVAGWGPGPGEYAAYDRSQKEAADQVLAAAKAQADKLGVDATILHVPNTFPAEAIVETAKEGGHNLIVMASHGRRGLGRLILGSQTSEVLSHSPIPVLVIR